MKRVVLLNIYRGRQNIISENKDNIQQKQINNVEIIDIITERFKNI